MSDILQSIMTIIVIIVTYSVGGYQLEKRFNIQPAYWVVYGFVFGAFTVLVLNT